MKKILSVFLALFMMLSVVPTAFAGLDIYSVQSQIPVIIVSGDGATIVDKDGNELSKLTKFFTNNGGESENGTDISNIISSVWNVIWPLLYNGMLTGNYEPYYKSLQKELSEMFGDIILDENGEASNGSGIQQSHIEQFEYSSTHDMKGDKGYYDYKDYLFWYDWRLDPIQSADRLHEYIENIKSVTGSPEVAISCRCLGTNVVCAYIQKYGLDGIKGIAFDGSVCMGAEPISESISGKFKVDPYAIERILIDGNNIGLFNIDKIIIQTLDVAIKSGMLDMTLGVARKTIYKKLAEGVTSAVTLAAISYPNYWACVSVDDFDQAVNYVFGKKGSEKREKYAGMIEKITNYNENVKKHIPEILKSIPESGTNIGVIGKYGLQLLPICESRNEIADTFVSLKSASFGATCGTIYAPLSEEYIEAAEANGTAKYISPDKQVDASTCLFPDYTWFTKGIKHSEWTEAENKLLVTVITADRQLTINDFDETQFMIRDPENPSHTIAMTEENCHTENWTADDKNENNPSFFTRIINYIKSIFTWWKMLFDKIFKR